MTLRYRLLKAGDTLAYLGLGVLTWRFARGELHWRLAIGAAVLSAAWLALTALRHERLFATYFDVVSRLEVSVPAVLGIALAGIALLDTRFLATRVAAALVLAGWAALVLRYRWNRARYTKLGHGPLPARCRLDPPAEALAPGDLLLTSGRVASGLREAVGHGETLVRLADGSLGSFTCLMDRGAVLHPVPALLADLRARGIHWIALRLRAGLTPEQRAGAEAIVRAMLAENRAWAERANRRRRAWLARLPLPAGVRARLERALHTEGYDWLGLFMGRIAEGRWTCIGACLEHYRRLGVRTNPYGTGLLGAGTTLFDPIMPVRFLSDPAFELLTEPALSERRT